MIAARQKLTSREVIQTHRERFGGCGTFRKLSDRNIRTKFSNMGLVGGPQLEIDDEDASPGNRLRRHIPVE